MCFFFFKQFESCGYVIDHRKPSPKTVERIHRGVTQFALKLQHAILV